MRNALHGASEQQMARRNLLASPKKCGLKKLRLCRRADPVMDPCATGPPQAHASSHNNRADIIDGAIRHDMRRTGTISWLRRWCRNRIDTGKTRRRKPGMKLN